MNKGRLRRPTAQRGPSVVGGTWLVINHTSAPLLTLWAVGVLGGWLLQEHPLQRPSEDGGLYTQVNNSPCPEGTANNAPSITKSTERKRVGSKEGKKQQTFIYCLHPPLSLFQPFFFDDLRLALRILS